MGIAVIGIGQQLRGDDEAGLAAVRLWEEIYPETAGDSMIRVELAESPGVGLLSLLAGVDSAVLVDAVLVEGEPGDLLLLEESDLAAYLDGAGSAHGWGVSETLALGHKIQPEAMPERIIIIGIGAGQVGLGRGFSPGVAAALEPAARLIQEMVEGLVE